jgi:hypothetical protein
MAFFRDIPIKKKLNRIGPGDFLQAGEIFLG